MDGQQFDSLTRRLASATSRRNLITGFAAAVLAHRFAQLDVAAQTCSIDDDCPGETTCSGASCTCFGPQSTCTLDEECCGSSLCGNGKCCLVDGSAPSQQDPVSCCSGILADGTCCNTTCTGECNQCNVPGSEGTCTDVDANCLDMNPCTTNACSSGMCTYNAVSDGASPPDLPAGQVCCGGEACQAPDACTPASCSGGACSSVSACPDGSEYCVNGTCVGCLSVEDCTLSEDPCFETRCSAGQCVDVPVDCSDLDGTCLTGICFNGLCTAVLDQPGSACDTGAPCLIGACDATGQCIGAQRDCSDLDDLCVIGICDDISGNCEPLFAQNGADCGQGAICFNGLCICGNDRIVCDGACVHGECCDASDCVTGAGGSSCGKLACIDYWCVYDASAESCGKCQICDTQSGTCVDACGHDECCCHDGRCGKHCCGSGHGHADIDQTPVDTLPNTGSGSTASAGRALGLTIAGGVAAWAATKLRPGREPEATD